MLAQRMGRHVAGSIEPANFGPVKYSITSMGPYVARALADEFTERTSFVQERGGRVPTVDSVDLIYVAAGCAVRIEMAVRSLFSGEWSDPRLTIQRTLGPFELEDIAACARALSVIPVSR